MNGLKRSSYGRMIPESYPFLQRDKEHEWTYYEQAEIQVLAGNHFEFKYDKLDKISSSAKGGFYFDHVKIIYTIYTIKHYRSYHNWISARQSWIPPTTHQTG